MKKINLAITLFSMVFTMNAQIATFKKQLVKPIQLSYYALNHLGDTSSIVDNEIAKETVLQTYTFKDPFLGNITVYDERNPLQQLVYYKNTQNVVLLDNQLSVKEKIALLEKYPELDAVYAALTAQSSIWIFDQVSKRWCTLSVQQQHPNFISNPILSYDFITTSGNFAYWQKENVVYGIDIYGKILEEIKLPSLAKLLAINGNYLLYNVNGLVFLENIETKQKQQLKEAGADVIEANFVAKNLSLLTANKLYLYNIN